MANPVVGTSGKVTEITKIPEGPPATEASVPGRRHPFSSLEKEWRILEELGSGSGQQWQPQFSNRNVCKHPIVKPRKHNNFMANREVVSEYECLSASPNFFLLSFPKQVHCNTLLQGICALEPWGSEYLPSSVITGQLVKPLSAPIKYRQ